MIYYICIEKACVRQKNKVKSMFSGNKIEASESFK